MSGFPVLMLMLAAGLTYGWKPDGDGGVEYVVQIPPEQLSQLERHGSISSVIDPAVRGRVSRIVIQVGDEPLPRITPPLAASRSNNALESEDYAAIPIPEMDAGSTPTPIVGLGSPGHNETSEVASVMKPQAGSGASSGLALPPSLAGAAAGGSSAGGPSGRGADPANSPATRNIIPPPATRSPATENNSPRSSTETSLPDFTGGNNGLRAELAMPRAGGPTTEPTTVRDRNWTIPTNDSNRQNLPTTAPVTSAQSESPFERSRSDTAAGSPVGRDSTRANLGLNANESFGRAPAGVELPQPQWAQQAPQSPAPLNSIPRDAGQSGAQHTNANQGNGQTASSAVGDANRGYSANAMNSNATSAGAAAANGGGYPPNASIYDRSRAASIPTRPIASAQNTNPPATNSGGARAMPPAGGADFFVDAYGNPVDRDGRPLAPANRFDANSSAAAGGPVYSLGAADRRGQYAQNTFADGGVDAYGRRVTPQGDYERYARQVAAADPRSPSDAALAAAEDRRPATAGSADVTASQSARTAAEEAAQSAAQQTSGELTRAERLAQSERLSQSRLVDPEVGRPSQPLLTWLLLISFVGNVYLVFWMKKLLVKYRDLVAAKRMAAANGNS